MMLENCGADLEDCGMARGAVYLMGLESSLMCGVILELWGETILL